MRVTTNGTLLGYRSSLMRSAGNLNYARNKVLTQRNFNSYAEDPAAATQAFKLRRAFSRTSDQLTTNKSLTSKFQAGWDALNTVKSDLAEKLGKVSALTGATGTAGAGRQPLGEVLVSGAESIIQTLNSQYGENFIFAGNDGLNVPFSWGSDGSLMYRGVAVDSGAAAGLPKGTPPDPSTVTAGSDWEQYYTANPDFAKLASMSHESAYMDVGAGLKEANGKLIESSAFDSSLSGIGMTGFGVDKDGDPKNIASIMKQLGEIYKRCDADTGDYASKEDETIATRLGDKLKSSMNELTNQWTALDGQAKYLESNEKRLTSSAGNLNEQILSIEQADLADAITEFSWAQYCYNSALKVGNSILSQSLMDYMQ